LDPLVILACICYLCVTVLFLLSAVEMIYRPPAGAVVIPPENRKTWLAWMVVTSVLWPVVVVGAVVRTLARFLQ